MPLFPLPKGHYHRTAAALDDVWPFNRQRCRRFGNRNGRCGNAAVLVLLTNWVFESVWDAVAEFVLPMRLPRLTE